MGSDAKRGVGLLKAPTDCRLAVEIVRKPAAKDVTAKAAVAKEESTRETAGTECSVY